MGALRTHRLMRAGIFLQRRKETRERKFDDEKFVSMCRSTLGRPLRLTEAEVCFRKENDRIRGKLMRSAYLELFDVP